MSLEGIFRLLIVLAFSYWALNQLVPEWTVQLVLSIIIVILILLWFALRWLTELFGNSLAQRSEDNHQRISQELSRLRQVLTDMLRPQTNPKRLPAVFGRLIDDALQKLIYLTLRDFVGAWNSEQGFGSTDQLTQDIKEDVWKVVQNLQERLSKIDESKLICVDIATRILNHLEKIRLVDKSRPLEKEDYLPHLLSHFTEKEYLRQISSALIVLFFPDTYSTIEPVKHFLQEMLACKVLFPAVATLTDPDFINMKILTIIEERQPSEEEESVKCYERPETNEEFLELIQSIKDIETLKLIRYDIVKDIMKAAQSEGYARRVLTVEETDHLKQLISRLTDAKNLCEKRLHALGWMGYPVEVAVEAGATIDTTRMTIFKILTHRKLRPYITKYLNEVELPAYVCFWMAVQDLRGTPRTNWHSVGAEIFYTYIRSPISPIKVDKPTMKRMEEFLLGNGGIQVFYDVQAEVVQTLQTSVYPTFCETELYRNMIQMIEATYEEDDSDEIEENLGSTSDNEASTSVDRSNYTRHKLSQLEERLSNKTQALEALRNSLKPESRVLVQLEGEIEALQVELRQMEAHVMRTEEWGEHLGQWRAVVQVAEMSEDKEIPQFVLVVHHEDENDSNSVSTGWVVLRKLQDFQELHRKLCQLSSDVKGLELPTKSLRYRLSKTIAANTLVKAKVQIQKYLQFILEDERLNQSEALYAFLSPSSNHLKSVEFHKSKKNKFSLATMLRKNGWEWGDQSIVPKMGQTLKEPSNDDISLLVDNIEESKNADDPTDTIAEPLYLLLNELCHLNTKFSWIRRTLIMTIQLTYNRSINRAIRVIIREWFSEQHVFSCIQGFIKSWWPNDRLNASSSVRSADEVQQTRGEARERLLDNIPILLSTLVGHQSARLGAATVFDALQEPKLNKHIFYQMMEIVLLEVFPELKN